jgi:hypothetical protein
LPAKGNRDWIDSARPLINLHVQSLVDFADTAALVGQMGVIVRINTAIAYPACDPAKRMNVDDTVQPRLALGVGPRRQPVVPHRTRRSLSGKERLGRRRRHRDDGFDGRAKH